MGLLSRMSSDLETGIRRAEPGLSVSRGAGLGDAWGLIGMARVKARVSAACSNYQCHRCKLRGCVHKCHQRALIEGFQDVEIRDDPKPDPGEASERHE